jgi:hypothetical protein
MKTIKLKGANDFVAYGVETDENDEQTPPNQIQSERVS